MLDGLSTRGDPDLLRRCCEELADLAASRSVRLPIAALGGIGRTLAVVAAYCGLVAAVQSVLLSLARRDDAAPRVLAAALSLLRVLFQDDDAALAVATCGGIPTVVTTVAMDVRDPAIAATGCHLLRRLDTRNAASAGALDLIAKVRRLHAGVPETFDAACSAAWEMAARGVV